MIHVCFGLHDKDGRYSKFTGTAILSMFENHYYPPPSITVHILHDNTLTEDNRDKFSYIANKYGQIIKFNNVEKICAEEVNRINQLFADEQNREGFSMGKFYRLLLPNILSEHIEKVIYLDSDIIVNLDINELWQIPLSDKPLAAVPEKNNGIIPEISFGFCKKGFVKPENYFNSGVLVMNLKQIRQNELENIWKGIHLRAKTPESGHFDQEILNYCFSEKCLKLPLKFNTFVRMLRKRMDLQTCNRIYHYTAHCLNLDMSDAFNNLWFSYFEKTSWFTKDIIGRINELIVPTINNNINKRESEFKNLALNMSILLAYRQRAFFTIAPNVEAIKKFFAVRADELIIPFESEESIPTLAYAMETLRGQKIFFILMDEYPQLCEALTEVGFVEGLDFVNAAKFLNLPDENETNLELNTYEFIRNM